MAVGGHDSIKSKIMDDIEFAKLMKGKGYMTYCVFGEEIIQNRMYKHFKDIWRGFSKNMTDIMRNASPVKVLYITIKSFLLGWGPIFIPVLGFIILEKYFSHISSISYYLVFGLALCPTFFMFLFSVLVANELRIPIIYGLFFPFGYSLHGCLNLVSYLKMKRGIREWKGRTYKI